jgi:hypothetical protein
MGPLLLATEQRMDQTAIATYTAASQQCFKAAGGARGRGWLSNDGKGMIKGVVPDLTIRLDSFLYVFKYDNSGQFCSQPITRWASAHDILPKIILIPNELLYMLILCIPCQSVNVLL